ncbi:conserved hypothetical protein (plasmid) [Borreliella burgdorferi 64b]|nr:conserved hypothetical protein [Borreliella burgdorferi 64b]
MFTSSQVSFQILFQINDKFFYVLHLSNFADSFTKSLVQFVYWFLGFLFFKDSQMGTAEDSIPLYAAQLLIFVRLGAGKLLLYACPESRNSERGEPTFTFKLIPKEVSSKSIFVTFDNRPGICDFKESDFCRILKPTKLFALSNIDFLIFSPISICYPFGQPI